MHIQISKTGMGPSLHFWQADAVRNDPGPYNRRALGYRSPFFSLEFPLSLLHILQPQVLLQLQPLGLELTWLVVVGWAEVSQSLSWCWVPEPLPTAEYAAGQAGWDPAPWNTHYLREEAMDQFPYDSC